MFSCISGKLKKCLNTCTGKQIINTEEEHSFCAGDGINFCRRTAVLILHYTIIPFCALVNGCLSMFKDTMKYECEFCTGKQIKLLNDIIIHSFLSNQKLCRMSKPLPRDSKHVNITFRLFQKKCDELFNKPHASTLHPHVQL